MAVARARGRPAAGPPAPPSLASSAARSNVDWLRRRRRATPAMAIASRSVSSGTAAAPTVAFPAAAAIRPQFGSRPWIAALTRLLPTTSRATARASAWSGAPLTWHVRSVVAPSPSAACWRARERATASTALASDGNGGLRCSISVPPAAPEASRNTVSFVLVSPSTVSWFQVRSTMGPRMACNVPRRDGRIREHEGEHRRHPRMDHPDALCDAGDDDLPRRPGRTRKRDRDARRLRPAVRRPQLLRQRRQGLVGGGEPSRHQALERGRGSRRPAGGVPISPVESASVSPGATSSAPASAAARSAWSRSPAAPVAAFAQPLVEIPRRRAPPAAHARFARLSRTGAAWTRLVVNVAAALGRAGRRSRAPRGRARRTP